MLLETRVNSKFPIVDRKDMCSPWRRVVLQKLRNKLWVLIDEMGDGEVGSIESSDDVGPIAEWGLYYRHPITADFNAAKDAVVSKNTAQAEEEERLNESPTRKYLRDEVAVALQKQGQSMKTKAAKIGGDVDLGSIVQISLSDVDTVKVDGKVLTLVVVEKVGEGQNNPSKYRLACKEGPLKGLYHRFYLTPLPEATKELMGLDTIFTTWKVKAALTVREAARLMLMVGGQEMRDGDGKKQYCGCKKGTCRSNKCVCFLAKRLCGSRCHGGHNPKCLNNTNG
jgi:hypothetical protein